MKKNIFLLTTLGLVTTTLASLSGADSNGAINPQESHNILSDPHFTVYRVADDILDTKSRSISIVDNNIDIDDDTLDDPSDMLIGASTGLGNGHIAAILRQLEVDIAEYTELVIRGHYQTELGDINGELYSSGNNIDDESQSIAKIALERGYNDLLINGIFILENTTAADGDDDEEIRTVDAWVAYRIADFLSATANFRTVDQEDLDDDTQAEMNMLLLGLEGYMDISDNLEVILRANIGTTEGTETNAADAKTDNEEDIVHVSLTADYSSEKFALVAEIGQITADNGTNKEFFQRVSAEASSDVTEDVKARLYYCIDQQQLENDVQATISSMGASIDWRVNPALTFTGSVLFFELDFEAGGVVDLENTETSLQLRYYF
jgi:hypothetical protein